jgi:hypothetical protein
MSFMRDEALAEAAVPGYSIFRYPCARCSGEKFVVKGCQCGYYAKCKNCGNRETIYRLEAEEIPGFLRPRGVSAGVHEGVHENMACQTQREVKRGAPRLGHRSETLTATEPWRKDGLSRATWYRRRKEAK